MGSHRRDESPGKGRKLSKVVRVVPDVPSFAVDDGFAYRVPETVPEVTIGSIVRVPLGGRRVRGWVIAELSDAPTEGLRDILSRSGDLPIFDRRLLEVLRWVAIHHVAPLSVVLPKAGPPNLPRSRSAHAPFPVADRSGGRSRFVIGSGPWDDLVAEAAAGTPDGGMTLVLAPTVAEAGRLVATAASRTGRLVLGGWSDLPAAEVTSAWVRARSPGVTLVGTLETSLWHLPALTASVMVEPARRGYKAKQTPTIHAREVVRRRAGVQRFPVVFAGAVPPGEVLYAGAEMVPSRGRAWPLVEVVSREEEPPGGGPVMERTRAAIQGVVARGGSVFVFVPRRGYARAFRCASCGTLRRCTVCGAGPDRGSTCVRCGSEVGPCTQCGGERFQALGVAVGTVVDDLSRTLGDQVGEAASQRPVVVGTERDLPSPGSSDLTVAVEPETLWLAPNYRAEEEALRILARVAGTVVRGRGRRCLVQTSQPGHRVVVGLRSGDGRELMAHLIAERAASGFPPAGELLTLEIRGEPSGVDADLRDAGEGSAQIYGPAESRDRWRWLVQGGDLHRFRVRLRPLVQGWRDRDIRVRVDADPVDL